MGDNIISVNVPNAVSITLMAVVGLMLVQWGRKALAKRNGGGGVTVGASFTG